MKKQQIKLRPAVIATLLGIGICLFFIVCGNLNYETNDDELLNLIAAGAWGFKSSQYLVYQNIVLGYVFKMLYTVLPCLNNYAIFFIICNVVCVVLLAYRFGKTHSTAVSILFVTGLCILLKADFFETIQYTKNAFLYAAVGWIYLLSQNSDHKISDSVIGIVLLSISFMTRKESMLFSTPFVIAWLIGHRSIIRDHRTIFIKRGCILLIVIVGLFLINKLSLRSPEWNAYIRYNDVRTELLDYGIPSYEENSQFYDSTGISENDLDVMSQWNYGDNQVYDYETMHSIADLKHRPLFSISSLITSMEDLYTVAHSSALPAIWFLLIAAIVFLHNKEGAIFMVLSSLVIFVEYVFLNNNLRVIWRVEIGIWLIPILLALFELNGERETDSSLSIPSLIASLLALSVIASQLVFNFAFRKHFSISLKNEDNRYDEITELMEAYPDTLFLADTLSLSSYSNRISYGIYDISRTKYKDLFQNVNLLGSWMYPSPHVVNYEANSGIENPLESLLEDNVIFLIKHDSFYENESDLILTFLQEHYDSSAEYVVIDTVGDLDLIKYSHGT